MVFNYYLDNAKHRLDDLYKYYKKLPKLVQKTTKSKDRWDCQQARFKAVVKAFADDMGVSVHIT